MKTRPEYSNRAAHFLDTSNRKAFTVAQWNSAPLVIADRFSPTDDGFDFRNGMWVDKGDIFEFSMTFPLLPQLKNEILLLQTFAQVVERKKNEK
jgi:hypothetical protein